MAIDVEKFYRTYGPMVLRRCRSLLRDENEAEDATQDTFVRLLQYETRLNSRAPSSLLYTIATNVCLNRLRVRDRDRERVSCAGEDIARFTAPDEHTERVLAAHFLDRVFDEQKHTTRSIVADYYVNNMTLEETAARRGMSVSGVRKRLKRFVETGRARSAA